MTTNTAHCADVLTNAGVTVLERGWLSANNTLIQGDGPTALIDSGYWSHSHQTLALLDHSLGKQPLKLLLNTHLHSDHCGGNAAMQKRYPDLHTQIPPGQAASVSNWDPVALTYAPTGQHCPQFQFQSVLVPGTTVRLGSYEWQIHAAKGHDPHSIILFQPQHRILISADALWENGFGVVFPELEGIAAFDEVAETLDLIEQLEPSIIIPGHGVVFQDLFGALSRARAKLNYFAKNPAKHHRHGLKVLVKYKLLEWQHIEISELMAWSLKSSYLKNAMPSNGDDIDTATQWMNELLQELANSQAVKLEGSMVRNN